MLKLYGNLNVWLFKLMFNERNKHSYNVGILCTENISTLSIAQEIAVWLQASAASFDDFQHFDFEHKCELT